MASAPVSTVQGIRNAQVPAAEKVPRTSAVGPRAVAGVSVSVGVGDPAMFCSPFLNEFKMCLDGSASEGMA